MRNERLAAAMRSAGVSQVRLAYEIDVDPKTVERWIAQGRTPHPRRRAAVAALLGCEQSQLWDVQVEHSDAIAPEVVALYAHRADTPKELWLNLLTSAQRDIWLLANASLFLPEENPVAIEILRKKAAAGVRVRILLGDPDSPEAELRGVEERLYDAIPGRIRMAIAYYRPLLGEPGIDFRQHTTTLYNSIFVFDDQMLINQHIYGAYGYIAPILHLRRMPGHDMFETYERSFERVWETSRPMS
ncbi:XRE family transcriptional regulator [Nocardioides sp. NPDC057772]|uniref:XRE family transcriptional regulator n=1 Tax=Nocardioides sp. NPDC057772 TaxID=3346245 RepID=UPI00366D0554